MSAQRGFGLIELMVASTIGLFLVAILVTVFSATRQTSIARQGLSTLQDSERLAMTFISSGIQGAGYQPNPTTISTAAAFPALAASLTTTGGAFLSGQSITGTGSSTGYGAISPLGTDTLSVRFVASALNPLQGCTAGLTSGTLYTDYFFVNTATNTLNCIENSGTAIPLVAGVRGMAVHYGVDTTGSGSITEYLAATAVTNWTTVKTVSITLQFANPLAGQPSQPASVSFTRTISYMNGL